MGRLEDTLRDTLRHRAAGAPAVEALADRAMETARRARSRRTAAASVAAALTVLLVGVGVASFHRAGGGAPGPAMSGSVTGATTPPARGLPLEVVVGDQLIRSSGATVTLRRACSWPADSISKVP